MFSFPFTLANLREQDIFQEQERDRAKLQSIRLGREKAKTWGTVGGRVLSQPQWGGPVLIRQAGVQRRGRRGVWDHSGLGHPAGSCRQPARTEASGPQLPRTKFCQQPVSRDRDPVPHLKVSP